MAGGARANTRGTGILRAASMDPVQTLKAEEERGAMLRAPFADSEGECLLESGGLLHAAYTGGGGRSRDSS